MTREEEIKKAVQEFIEERKTAIGRAKRGGWYFADIFEEGIKWADKHPKLSWINVENDLPYNHEELMSAKCETKEVFVLKDSFGNPGIDYMIKENGKWRWFYYSSTKYWMPIPEPPKEQEIRL